MWLHLFRKYIRRRGGKKHVLASWRWLDASSSLLLLVIEENSTRNCRDVEIGNKKLGMRIPRESTRQTRNFPQLFFFPFLKRYRLNFGDSRTLSWNLLNSGMGIITTKVMTSVMNNVDPPRDGYTSPHKSIKLFPSRLHPRSKAFGAITADVVYPSGAAAAAAGWSFFGGEKLRPFPFLMKYSREAMQQSKCEKDGRIFPPVVCISKSFLRSDV